MKTAELTPTAQKIDKLIKRIDEGDIKIPAFQRGYVWKQNQVYFTPPQLELFQISETVM